MQCFSTDVEGKPRSREPTAYITTKIICKINRSRFRLFMEVVSVAQSMCTAFNEYNTDDDDDDDDHNNNNNNNNSVLIY